MRPAALAVDEAAAASIEATPDSDAFPERSWHPASAPQTMLTFSAAPVTGSAKPGVRERAAAAVSLIYRAGWRMLTAGMVLVTGLLLVMAWGVALNRMEAESRLLIEAATRQQESIALVIAENIAQVLDRARLMTLAAPDGGAIGRGETARKLASMLAVDSAFLRVGLYDQQRQRVFSSSVTEDSEDLKLLVGEMLSTPAALAGQGGRIAPRASDQEMAWQVPLLFPVTNGRGDVDGVLVAVLDLGYLLGLYRNIDLGSTGAVHVLRGDGSALAEMGRAGLVVGPPPLDLGWLPSNNQGAVSRIDRPFGTNERHVTSYHAIERFPLVIAVSRELGEIEADRIIAHSWIRRLLIGVSIVIALSVFWVAGNLRRQDQLLRSLRQANAGNRQLIDELESEKKRAFQLASHDPLCGLHNRRMFLELAASHLARAKRSHKHYALMYLDLDRFKGINDTLGHHVGDLLLATISARLRASVRESDVLARLGGDEFAVLLTGLDRIEDAAEVADKLVRVVGEPCHDLDGHDLQVGASIGIAIFPRDGQDVDMLCRHADAAMYESKRGGRGRFTFYDAALNPAGEWQFGVEQRLPRAIADSELILHFQPKVRIADFRITGLEALVRWQHPEHGLIYPKDFIEIAENTGQIVALGKWVAEACCRQLVAWRDEGLAAPPIAFNVSARQLLDDHLPAYIANLLQKYDLDGAMLEIEITETALVDSIERAVGALAALEALGLRIALDDFGNGFSNLSYIRSLPISTLKIDRSFVNDLRNSPDDAVIVDSIISLAHNLKMRVVAEGVESLDQIVHLKTAGCDEIQGYFLSRPVPEPLMRELIGVGTLSPL